jgi:phosphoribosylanthranilate isomerase
MTAPRIKICGVRTPGTARVAASAGADYVGVVFAPGSPRRVTPEEGRAIAAALPPGVEPVALFQLERAADLTVAAWPFEWVQLHGEEDEELVAAAARRHRVIRGFRFSREAVLRWNACRDVDVLLVDGGAGGAGVGFDHAELAALRDEVHNPILLAGGLAPDNVATAVQAVAPWGVDVSSGVESARGVKDDDLIRAFCAAVRSAARPANGPPRGPLSRSS